MKSMLSVLWARCREPSGKDLRNNARIWAALVASCVLVWAADNREGRAEADVGLCAVITDGLDPAIADTVTLVYEATGYAQVFEARDSLVRAITIWRPAQPDSDAQERLLWVTELTLNGEPDLGRVLVRDYSLVRQVGDGVHPVPYRFEFDPPLALPRRGKFALIIKEYCDGGYFILASNEDPYPAGNSWFMSRNCCCLMGPARMRDPRLDLIFEIEYCAEPTPAKRKSWGTIKVGYR